MIGKAISGSILLVFMMLLGYYFVQFVQLRDFRKDFENKKIYKCPQTEYLNCMPGPDNANLELCNDQVYIEWAKLRCEGFKGIVY